MIRAHMTICIATALWFSFIIALSLSFDPSREAGYWEVAAVSFSVAITSMIIVDVALWAIWRKKIVRGIDWWLKYLSFVDANNVYPIFESEMREFIERLRWRMLTAFKGQEDKEKKVLAIYAEWDAKKVKEKRVLLCIKHLVAP